SGTPQDLVVGDIDADGHLDLMVTVQYDVSIFWGTGAGTFSATPTTLQLPGGYDPANQGWGGGQAAAVADLNGDGKLDPIGLQAAGGNSCRVVMFPNAGGRTFLSPVLITTTNGTPCGWRVAVGRIDSDNIDDLLIGDAVSPETSGGYVLKGT